MIRFRNGERLITDHGEVDYSNRFSLRAIVDSLARRSRSRSRRRDVYYCNGVVVGDADGRLAGRQAGGQALCASLAPLDVACLAVQRTLAPRSSGHGTGSSGSLLARSLARSLTCVYILCSLTAKPLCFLEAQPCMVAIRSLLTTTLSRRIRLITRIGSVYIFFFYYFAVLLPSLQNEPSRRPGLTFSRFSIHAKCVRR